MQCNAMQLYNIIDTRLDDVLFFRSKRPSGSKVLKGKKNHRVAATVTALISLFLDIPLNLYVRMLFYRVYMCFYSELTPPMHPKRLIF